MNLEQALLMPVIMAFMAAVTPMVGEVVKWIVRMLTRLYNNVVNYGRITMTIVDNPIDVDYANNNRILINAVLFGFGKGTKYKINNKSTNNKFTTYTQRENNREILATVDGKFHEDSIDIEYYISEKQGGSKDDPRPVVYIHNLELSTNKSIDHIKSYLTKKRAAYIKTVAPESASQYIYTPHTYTSARVEYMQTVFTTEKSFDSWFCAEKPKVRNILYEFNNRIGIYALPTISYKFGILLHGEPGCGKSTFIKALANATQRHIILVTLEKFMSTSSFTTLFRSDYLITRNRDHFLDIEYVPMNKRLLVFEDIDTAGDIVAVRKEEPKIETNTDSKTKDAKDAKDATPKSTDKLTLGDILNALDGVCEPNGLMYVMTTNHLDKLDPALIRPGRINISLEMKALISSEIVEMLEYYYIKNNIHGETINQSARAKIIERLGVKFGGKLNASKIENACSIKKLSELEGHFNSLLV